MSEYHKELRFAQQLALKANVVSDKYYRKEPNTKTKSDKSPVTVADEEINKYVIDMVKKNYPGHGVLGEEESWQLEKEALWVCDPIDGTIAYSMGDPVFTFSIALVVRGKPVMAVVRELANKRTFWAIKNKGAYVDGIPISVSQRKLNQAWLAFPTELKRLYKYRKIYETLDTKAYQSCTIHSAVFKGMLIAQGLADGNVLPEEEKGNPWDFAAVKLIVEEAGGKVTSADGKEQRYDKPLSGVVISNGVIHNDLLKAVMDYKNN